MQSNSLTDGPASEPRRPQISILIPPAIVPGEKTDIRDWINHQRSLGKSRDEIRAAFFALPRIDGDELRAGIAEAKAEEGDR